MPAQNISITDEQQAHAKKMVESGKYATVSAYMSDLIRHDMEQQAYHDRLYDLIQEGLNSGDPIEVTPEGIGEIIQQGIDRARAEKLKQAG